MITDPCRRLGFSLLLLCAVAGLLLWSDRHSRQGQAPAAAQIPVALLTHSSNPLLDETRLGVLDGLAAHGFRDGGKIALATFNPEGDLPTGNLMAQKIAGGGYRLAISISTVMLQALANANRDGRVAHVFGAVTSPVAAGVGIKALDSLDKPRHLTGIATPQPVADIFKLAKRINPALKTVGVVWNPGQELFIRWQLPKAAGSGANLAIDDLTINAVPAPGAMALLGVAGLLGTRRRR